jgi:hypothetical protein
MNARQRKRMLYLATGLLTAVTAGVVAWGLTTSVRIETSPISIELPASSAHKTNEDTAPATSPTQATARPSLPTLKRLASMPLRRPLREPDKEKDTQKTKAKPNPEPREPLGVTLIGTVIEPGHSMAILKKRDGTIELCRTGQQIKHNGRAVKVITVTRRGATVTYAGQKRRLQMPKRDNDNAQPARRDERAARGFRQ